MLHGVVGGKFKIIEKFYIKLGMQNPIMFDLIVICYNRSTILYVWSCVVILNFFFKLIMIYGL